MADCKHEFVYDGLRREIVCKKCFHVLAKEEKRNLLELANALRRAEEADAPRATKKELDEMRHARDREILLRYDNGATTPQIAEEFGLSTDQINGIIRVHRGKRKETNHRANICFDCALACGGCSWSARFEPVPGWTAEPVQIQYYNKLDGPRFTDTYSITACPLFISDKERRP